MSQYSIFRESCRYVVNLTKLGEATVESEPDISIIACFCVGQFDLIDAHEKHSTQTQLITFVAIEAGPEAAFLPSSSSSLSIPSVSGTLSVR